MPDDFRQRLAAALAATCKRHEIESGCISCDRRIAAVLAVRDDELERLRDQLREAADALRDVGKAALVVEPTLTQPYSDAPDESPWSRFMGDPARRAYNLGHRLRIELKARATAGTPLEGPRDA